MLKKLFRILIGFAAACLAAGITIVLFVLTPSEIAGLPPDVAGDRIGKALELAIAFAVQAALFTAPFALVALALGEALRRRQWTYYAIVGLIMAGLGIYAQRSTEGLGQASIANNYALTAFLTAGFVGGLVYWLVSGRRAGGSPPPAEPHPSPKIASHRDGLAGDRSPPAEAAPETSPKL